MERQQKKKICIEEKKKKKKNGAAEQILDIVKNQSTKCKGKSYVLSTRLSYFDRTQNYTCYAPSFY
jgi:hypothetical protein